MEQCTLKKCKQLFEYQYLNSYSETSGGQSSYQYLNVVHFLTPMLIKYVWQLKTIVFLHRCLICALQLWLVAPSIIDNNLKMLVWLQGTHI
jgi:hypothetical protein